MKKGFTLIELLAVIVILAIIATIAVPIILSIIEDTKESATLRNAEYYLDAVEQSIAKHSLNVGNNYSPNVCIIDEYGDLLCDNKDILKVDVKGEKPSAGRITFEKGKITNISLKIGNKTILKNDKGELVFGELVSDYIKRIYKETTTTTVNNIEYSLDEKHLLMNDRLGSNDVSKTEGNIRYYGANPNNYIDIGDRDSDGNIIFWRIIGLFKDVDVTDEDGNVIRTEDLVKIIRADILTAGDRLGFSWDYTSDGTYDNNWHDSTLQVMLNNAYYNSETTNYYYSNNSTIALKELDFVSTGLSSEVHSKVERVKWNLGGHSIYDIYANEIYKYERTGSNQWSGKIALMYPSDYGYSTNLIECQVSLAKYSESVCISTNWLNNLLAQWTLTPVSNYTESVFRVWLPGNIDGGVVNPGYRVRPVLYLNSDVGILEEKETSEGLKYLVIA